MFGSVLTETLRQEEVLAHSGGDGKSKRTYPLAEFNSWQVHDAWENEAAARKQRDRRAWA